MGDFFIDNSKLSKVHRLIMTEAKQSRLLHHTNGLNLSPHIQVYGKMELKEKETAKIKWIEVDPIYLHVIEEEPEEKTFF